VTRRRLLIILTACIFLACWVIFSPFLATSLIVEHPLEKADAIMVLSGSAAYKERTRLAAELYAKGIALKIIISDDGGRGGWSQADQTNPPFVELARRQLVQNGVPSEAIVQLPREMTGTDSEAKALSEFVGDQQVRSVLIVTSPYHTRRAYSAFSNVLADRDINVGIVSPPIGPRSPEPKFWWLSGAGWQNVAGEYVKILGYWLFY
jgi:uncharacterized SAM-binding protein YcdF (DUF218 family)